MRIVKVREIKGFIAWLIKILGGVQNVINIKGWTAPWKIIYLRPDLIHDEKELAHELTHIKQMDDYGPFIGGWILSALAWYQNIRYGYTNNKYEVEARQTVYANIIKNYKLDYKE